MEANALVELVTTHWRSITHSIWNDLLSTLRIRITAVQADAATFCVIILASQVANQFLRNTHAAIVSPRRMWLAYLNVACVAAVFFVFFFPAQVAFYSELFPADPLIPTPETAARNFEAPNLFGAPLPIPLLIGGLYLLQLLLLLFVLTRTRGSVMRWLAGALFAVAYVLFSAFACMMDMASGVQPTATYMWTFATVYLALGVALVASFVFDTFALTRAFVVVIAIWVAGELASLVGPLASYLESAAHRT
jgi:hypothetical protein